MHRLLLFAALVVTVFVPLRAFGQSEKPERTDIRIAVGGKSLMIYLPLRVTERLGYFKEAGLNVEITDFESGSRSLQALMAGNVDVTAGSFDHTIQMQAKGQPVIAVVETGRYPGIVLGLINFVGRQGPGARTHLASPATAAAAAVVGAIAGVRMLDV